ncbi:hypothetical protein WMY93_010738 [Mugilogobius chulae]|uniref:UDP-glucuronosyltransferase n=1 Tax=Mugilogobius chulae TaxID=88201 RepID=A0AAW0PC16_9GOBI
MLRTDVKNGYHFTLFPQLLVFLSFLTTVWSGKVLVFPVDGSHWVNMNLMIKGLHDRGHEVTVVRTATSWYVKETAPHYTSLTITLPEAICIEEEDFFVTFLVKMLAIKKDGGSPIAFMSFYWEMLGALSQIHQQASLVGVQMLENKALMQKLRDSKYDLVLIDPGLPVGVLIAHELGLPTVFNVRWITSGEGHFVVAPSPTSPTMPNIVYIGGFQCKPSSPLPPELEDFVQSSGDHGFILMSLGTLVKGLPKEITSKIAAAFAQLPQKVIWRHAGEKPDNLGNNTLLMKWLPQNDLLGHPKIKAFVSHGGTNGIYESIYHGVPIVGVPLLFDQPENVLRLEVRGAAKVLDVTHITTESFRDTVSEVVNNPFYSDNMKRLSSLHRDKPMQPLDTALFWIEFVMRHKGAAHLRTDSYKMPWYSYYSLDVESLRVKLKSELNQEKHKEEKDKAE